MPFLLQNNADLQYGQGQGAKFREKSGKIRSKVGILMQVNEHCVNAAETPLRDLDLW